MEILSVNRHSKNFIHRSETYACVSTRTRTYLISRIRFTMVMQKKNSFHKIMNREIISFPATLPELWK